MGRTSLVHVLVDDVDAHFERAKRAGATIVEELNDLPAAIDGTAARIRRAEWYFAQPIDR